MTRPFCLRCVAPPHIRFVLASPEAVLGRSSACDFVVDAGSVSRRHAKIRLAGAGITVHDLGSSNGTFVRGKRITESAVQVGETVRFGRVSFVLEFYRSEAGEEETADPPLPARDAVESLSPAQRRVYDLLVAGMAEKKISQQLNLSRHTVHNHVRSILQHFGVHSRNELMARLLNRDLD